MPAVSRGPELLASPRLIQNTPFDKQGSREDAQDVALRARVRVRIPLFPLLMLMFADMFLVPQDQGPSSNSHRQSISRTRSMSAGQHNGLSNARYPVRLCISTNLKIWAIAMHGRNESSNLFKITSVIDILSHLPHSSPAYGWLLVVRRWAPIS